MKTFDVLVVDDEPIAQDILETYIQKVPGLHLAGKCKNALEAFGHISRQEIDIILIDINMPEINGIDFLKSLKNPPLIIFTTAYSQYAVESYELDAIDYLLKPISFDRFLKAINKALGILQGMNSNNTPVATKQSAMSENMLFVKADGKLRKIDLDKLWLIEALKDYLKLYVDNDKIVVHSTMKNFEDQLAHVPYFVRVNKSYIVNLKFILEINGNIIHLKGMQIPIGNTYKDGLLELINNLKL